MSALGLPVRPPDAEDEDTWGALRLRVHTYLTEQFPPLELVTSVRAVVLRGAEVLVVRDPTRQHVLPGGRREPAETLEQTLRREVLEETGWELGPPHLIGVIHFRHLTDRPPDYAYPYPDFLQLAYAVEAVRHVPLAQVSGDYELEARLCPLPEVEHLALRRGERVLLQAALKQSRA